MKKITPKNVPIRKNAALPDVILYNDPADSKERIRGPSYWDLFRSFALFYKIISNFICLFPVLNFVIVC